jgi:hypothetical protein
MPDREYAEPARLNPAAAREPGRDLVENCTQSIFDVALIEMRVATDDTLNELGSNHRRRRIAGTLEGPGTSDRVNWWVRFHKGIERPQTEPKRAHRKHAGRHHHA